MPSKAASLLFSGARTLQRSTLSGFTMKYSCAPSVASGIDDDVDPTAAFHPAQARLKPPADGRAG
jgi:hypothetical protein